MTKLRKEPTKFISDQRGSKRSRHGQLLIKKKKKKKKIEDYESFMANGH